MMEKMRGALLIKPKSCSQQPIGRDFQILGRCQDTVIKVNRDLAKQNQKIHTKGTKGQLLNLT